MNSKTSFFILNNARMRMSPKYVFMRSARDWVGQGVTENEQPEYQAQIKGIRKPEEG